MGIKQRHFSFYSAAIGILIPIIVLMGWIFHAPLLRSGFSGFPRMIPLTAVNLIAIALNLLIAWRALDLSHRYQQTSPSKLLPTLGISLSVANLAVAGYTLLGHLFDFETGLSKIFLVRDVSTATGVLFGGNMSVQTALACVLLSSSLIIHHLGSRNRRLFSVFQILPILTILLSLIAFVFYIHDTGFQGPTKYAGQSVPTAFVFLVLAFGVLNLRPDAGIVKSLRGEGTDALFLRWYITFSILLPVFITLVITWGVRADQYPQAFANALFVVTMIAGLLGLGFVLSGGIRRLEAQRIELGQAHSKAALRASERSLKVAKDRLEVALEASKMGTWELDLATGTDIWSPITEEIFGFKPGEFPGTFEAFSDLIHPEDRETLFKAREEAIRNHRDIEGDFRIIKKDGEIRWIRTRGRCEYDPLGNPTRINGTAMDITNEMLYQKTIERALSEAESANQLKTTFLANMSHEIRTPLAAILGFTDLLADPRLSEEERTHYVSVIARNGESLSQLLNDILDLSKVESGYLDVEKLPFDLRDAMNDVIVLLNQRAQEKGVELTADFESATPKVIISDPTRLKQILINLVGNAVKFTSEGAVRVKVRVEQDSTAIEKLHFEISDSGIGISETQKKNLFQPFSQADGSMTRKFGGTGLGLVLSRRLAELLGGTVDLKESQLGKGSVFQFTMECVRAFPANKPNEVAPAVSRADEPIRELDFSPLQGVRILIAEDAPDNQKLLSRILGKQGAIVDFANNGAEAVQKSATENYDIVLMDIQMPVLDGYGATTQMRAQGFRKPIVALTAHAMSDVRQKCFDVGCNAHLAKPVDKLQLTQTILELTGRKTLSIQT